MSALDTQLLYALNALVGHSPLLDNLIVFCGDYLAYILGVSFFVLVAFSAYPRRRQFEIILLGGLAAVIARFGIDEIIRLFIHRPRPFSVLPVHYLFTDSSWSFPSGHASFFFALSAVLYLYNRKWGTWFFIISTVIVLGRVVAGVHYPSDILGGAVVGVVTGYFTYHIGRWILQKTINPTY